MSSCERCGRQVTDSDTSILVREPAALGASEHLFCSHSCAREWRDDNQASLEEDVARAAQRKPEYLRQAEEASPPSPSHQETSAEPIAAVDYSADLKEGYVQQRHYDIARPHDREQVTQSITNAIREHIDHEKNISDYFDIDWQTKEFKVRSLPRGILQKLKRDGLIQDKDLDL